MLRFSKELPTDKPVAGVHCVPMTDDGNLLMVWDRQERRLTTVGGRLEGNESVQEALDREAMEEAGVVLTRRRIPFAHWYWNETETYTVFFLAFIERFHEMPEGFEKTGYVIMNFPTALEMIERLEGPGERAQIIAKAREVMESAKFAG
ncbi:NUDIX hydrolase [Paenibacillus doosanensis]|uniref:NUDIX domain protein n=1 Tax=Paenibacillus konkukensis TaxID=2020716 RepID=A0ABY4RX90_9BACL|nr:MULTISPECIES: NUDIX hydrolase [Paenibacillus]MCS7458653.1 NUDIX hydrolase [Paenibacillus doosanensis]UQZ86823.1 NUDIX domain protein [Paenibacillus konkukensis]